MRCKKVRSRSRSHKCQLCEYGKSDHSYRGREGRRLRLRENLRDTWVLSSCWSRDQVSGAGGFCRVSTEGRDEVRVHPLELKDTITGKKSMWCIFFAIKKKRKDCEKEVLALFLQISPKNGNVQFVIQFTLCNHSKSPLRHTIFNILNNSARIK